MSVLSRQTLEQLKAEIAFREKLARQHVTGEVLLPNYYRKEEHDRILRERIAATHRQMTELARRGVPLTPFLELGAERGQRSLVLANDFAADGVAVDISFHQLKAMQHFAELFGKQRLPLRVCCNANELPFKAGSFPFVFAYQFLHHFPTPIPIMHEIHRVISRGYFYFGEEPYRRILKLLLYEQRSKVYSEGARRKHPYRRLFESFISAEASDETDHGIIENDDISLREWIDAMDIFQGWNAELSSVFNLTSRLEGRVRLHNLPNRLLGGLIAGMCRKHGDAPAPPATDVRGFLACPACRITQADGTVELPGVVQVDGGYRCPRCEALYPERDGVIFLLPLAQLRELYPRIAES